MSQFDIYRNRVSLGEVVGTLASDYITVMNAFDVLLTGY